MNARRRKFAAEYVRNGFNGVQAAFVAGYSAAYNSAQTEAWRLLRNAEIQKQIEKHGGKVTSAVSKQTTIVIVKDINSQSSKVKTAQENGLIP